MGLFGPSVSDIRKWEEEKNVDKIAKALYTKDMEVRKVAIMAFGNLRVVNGAPLLIPILNDKDIVVRGLAEQAIAKIGDVAVNDLYKVKNEIESAKQEAIVTNIGKLILGYNDQQIQSNRDKIEAIIYRFNNGK